MTHSFIRDNKENDNSGKNKGINNIVKRIWKKRPYRKISTEYKENLTHHIDPKDLNKPSIQAIQDQ